jgi:cell division protein FtsL
MKKILTISLIFSLIVITSFIKNSTKKIDEELFSLKENILNLNLELDNVKLEFDYLSSSEKLLNYQNLYFENKLTLKNINEIEIIDFTNEKILTNNVKIIDSEKK